MGIFEESSFWELALAKVRAKTLEEKAIVKLKFHGKMIQFFNRIKMKLGALA